MPPSRSLLGLTAAQLRRRGAEVIAAAERAPDAAAMLRATGSALARHVPSAASGWAVVDPDVVLPTWPIYVGNVTLDQVTGYWEREFQVDDTLLFRDLAVRPVPVGRLLAETSGLVARSSRYRGLIAELGFGDELRAVLRVSGTAWGMMELVRGKDVAAFSEVEADFIAGLVEPLAAVLRDKVIGAAVIGGRPAIGPGMLVFDSANTLKSANDSAREWLAEMPNLLDEPESLPVPVRVILAYAHAVEAGHQYGPARVRVRVRSGQWVVLTASPLRTEDGTGSDIAVVIKLATPAEMESIIVSAYDLSAREQEIAHQLARGASTLDLAEVLNLSVYTVRDHIKAVFAKVGVSSRGELVARLFTDRYL